MLTCLGRRTLASIPLLAVLVAVASAPALCASARAKTPATLTVSIAGKPVAGAVRTPDGIWVPVRAAETACGVKLERHGDVLHAGTNAASISLHSEKGTDYAGLHSLAEALDSPLSVSQTGAALYSRVRDVRFADGKLQVQTTLPVIASVGNLSTPDRIYVDIKGAKLMGKGSETKSETSCVRALRVAQYDESTVRVTAETAGKLQVGAAPVLPSCSIQIAITDPSARPSATAAQPGAQPAGPPSVVQSVRLENLENRARFHIGVSGPALAMSPGSDTSRNQYWLQLDNARLESADRQWQSNTGLIRSARLEGPSDGAGACKLIVEASRPLVARLAGGDGSDEVAWEFAPPQGAEGDWHGKTVLMDPGHGGPYPGARGNGIIEKELNLKICQAAVRYARERGLNVVLTRDGDQDISLEDRSARSAAVGASLFVSVHNNSNGTPDSVSGTEVYYHFQEPNCRLLAELVHKRVVAAVGLPGRGAKSDSVLYDIGLAVLRNATVPAILVEVGYLNNSHDAACLKDPATQTAAGRAIVDGVIDYLGGQSSDAGASTGVSGTAGKE